MSREDAYQAVQRHAMAAWQGGDPLPERLAADPEVTAHLAAAGLAQLFTVDYHLAHVDTIFRRVFGAP
jgi:adenylosuccinate lyase